MTDQPAVEPTPAEVAEAKLQELGEAFKKSSAPTGDHVDRAIAGVLDDKIFQDPGHIDGVRTVEFLRDAGVDDPAVMKQVLSGEEVSRAEYDAAVSMRSRLMADHDFQKRFLAGDGPAKRQMALLTVIITRGVKAA